MSAKMDWHPRYHRDALEGMRALTLEERGAYNTLLDLMYDRGLGVPDDDRFISGHMNCSMRLWRSIRQRLIDAGKIDVNNGFLTNRRAMDELGSQQTRQKKNGERSATTPRVVSETPSDIKENNDLFSHKTRQDIDSSVGSKDPTPAIDVNITDADPGKTAWSLAVNILVTRGKMKEPAARAFFGKLLGQHKIAAADMLGSLGTVLANQTQDPVPYLTKAAAGVARRRAPANSDDRPLDEGEVRTASGVVYRPDAWI